MKAFLKTIGIIIGVVLVLFVAIAIVVPIYFHPNDYKDEIAAAVQEKTGRELRIEGDIVLSVFPWLAVELGKLELGNAPGFPEEDFARLEKMEIGVKLLPLLSKRLEMRTVTVHGLELNLARDKQGTANWADLMALGASEQGAEKGEKGQGLPIAALGIGGLDIRDAALRWRDAQSGREYHLEGLSIETGAISPDTAGKGALTEPLDIKIAFDVEANEPQLKGHVALGTEFTADLGANTHQLSKLRLAANLAGKAIPNGKMSLELEGDVSADLAKQDLQVNNLRLVAGQIDASGLITVNRLLDAPAFHGKLQLATFNPRALLAELGQSAPETTDGGVLTSASLSATLQGTADRIRLEPLTVQLDDTTLQGNLAVANFSAPMPAIRFDLNADAIDADRYLPPAQDNNKTAPATPGATAAGASGLPLQTLRALDINGKARLGKLKVANLSLSDLALDVKAKGGVIKISPARMNLYQGGYAGNIGIDARGDRAKVSLDEKLTGVQVGPLLRDLQGDDLLSGRVRLAVAMNAVGAAPEDMTKTMNGMADFTFSDGMIKGIDIVHTVCNAVAKINKLAGKGTSEGPSEGTEFQEFTGKLPVTDGRVGINDTLLLKAPLLRVQGVSGSIDIGNNRFDNTKIIVKPAFTCKGQGGKALDQLNGANIPITCNGPMEGRSCLPDAKALARIVLGALGDKEIGKLEGSVKEKVEKAVTEKLGDKLGGELGKKAAEDLGGALKGLFGR
uniref:AsmA protein n=1 Tax=Candidatus Kentrum sp. DK TaxID=2126562 RepID=A0A450SK90_9GAMM|nr:MAG: AsmA protein [Candidatus Kentron sp. DK]